MTTLPKVVILDRENTLNISSSNPASPLYYITRLEHLILKPRVAEAVDILLAHDIPIVLATKQRCISKGLVTREQVNDINRRLEEMLGFAFDYIAVEESAEDKTALFKRIAQMYQPLVNTHDIWVFDDSEEERRVAFGLGFTDFDGTDLYAAVTKAFEVS